MIVIQTAWQQEVMRSVQQAGAMLHIDATGQTNTYGCPFFALLYRVSRKLAGMIRRVSHPSHHLTAIGGRVWGGATFLAR